jgi:type I restriction enzyme R subunit
MVKPEKDYIELDERNHVEKPLLDQLAGLGWEIFGLDNKQHPGATDRQTFAEVVMLPVLRDQVEEGVNQLTGKVRVTPLLTETQEAGA